MRKLLGIILVALLALAGWGYANILADPVVRRARIALPDWPRHAAPLRVALIADVHMQGPDMGPDRVGRLVAQVNAEHPDLILLAGDYVGDRQLSTRAYPDAEIAAALGRLSAPLGTWAVLGNHDHWRDGPAMLKALAAAGIHTLSNSAARVGVLTLAGVDDAHSGHADLAATVRAAAALPGPAILLTHSPDIAAELGQNLGDRFRLVLAGHMHCGQIVLPWIGSIASPSRYGDRYRCGLIRQDKRAVIVTGGWGASVVPLRFGTQPDWWLLTIGGK